MLTEKLQPLELATRILAPTSIQMFRQAPFNHYGWTILDRWALQQPEALARLQEQGTVVMYDRVLHQQEMEQDVLLQNALSRGEGLTTLEVLIMNEVPVNLEL